MMEFLDREPELERLSALTARSGGGLAVLYGRRRIGKTRILLEWARQAGGLYTVADESAPGVQRRYFARSVAARLPGFADVVYEDWGALLTRLAHDARAAGWRGPVIFDELPYLVSASRELPSVLQRWIDHDAKRAELVVAVAGSSQRMMQGLVLSADAPLYGRAHELLEILPLDPAWLRSAFTTARSVELVEIFAAWGGVPRYWELAADVEGDVVQRVDRLVLDPLGPLHREPDRLLHEEIPSALEVRPVLDAIGAGAHRVSEIAGRIGRPATSMARPLKRLVEMGLARREIPFGEPPRSSRRALYKIDDPFVRLWFRIIAPNRAQLTSATPDGRLRLLSRGWGGLVAEAWEDLCRLRLPRTTVSGAKAWGPALRWWRGGMPEWDVISESEDGKRILLGEAKWSAQAFTKTKLERASRALTSKPMPSLPARFERHEVVRALFVPTVASGISIPDGVVIVTADDLLAGAPPGRPLRTAGVPGPRG